MKPEALKSITEIELEAAVRGLFRPVKNRQVKHDNREPARAELEQRFRLEQRKG